MKWIKNLANSKWVHADKKYLFSLLKPNEKVSKSEYEWLLPRRARPCAGSSLCNALGRGEAGSSAEASAASAKTQEKVKV